MLPTRKLGSQGLEVSAIGLGCMGMSGAFGPADQTEALATLDRALELGCTFLDTAEVYGPYRNEELLGGFLKGRRERVTIATKTGWEIVDGRMTGGVDSRPATLRAALEGSLRRLGVDTIDLYYQHRVDPRTPIEDVVGTMAGFVKEGKVRYLGLSEAGVATLRRAHAVHPISALQSEYSLWERNLESEVIPAIRELGIGLAPFSPLGRGFLVNPKRPDELAEGDFRRNDPRLKGANFDANMAAAALVRRVAETKGVTASQVALAWLLQKGDDIVPLPGTKRRTYLEENLAAAWVRLTPGEMDELDSAMPPTAGERYNEAYMATIDR